MSDSEPHHDTALEELIAELSQQLLEQLERGQKPDLDALAAAHPEHEESIRGTLDAMVAMRDIGTATDTPKSPQREPIAALGTIGDYQIIREIGRGGMGVVYEATQISLDRRVALKILPYAAMLDQRALQRFRNEVTAAAKLNHPNVVDIYGVACDRGVHHYAMRMVDGLTMAEVIRHLRNRRDRSEGFPSSISSMHSELSHSGDAPPQTPSRDQSASLVPGSVTAQAETEKVQKTQSMRMIHQPPEHFRSVAEFGATVAQGLEHAHQQGVVHRDIKPSNLLLDASGRPWITDFGLAQVETGTALTLTGDVLGTARYMSPEQLMAKRIILDHRTDIYSLGITLYELLTLELPFDSENRQELFRQIMLDPPRRPRRINPAIPEDLETIVVKCIEKDAADRYQTAQELAADLDRFCRRQPIRARKATLAIKTRRWVQRNAAFVSGAMSVASISLIVMSAIIAFLISERGVKDAALHAEQLSTRKANKNLQIANTNRELAEGNFDYALEVLQDFVVQFTKSDSSRIPDVERHRQAILRKAAARFDQLLENNPDRTNLKSAYMDVLLKLGQSSVGIDGALADECFRRYIEFHESDHLHKSKALEKLNQTILLANAYNGRAQASSDRPQIARNYYRRSIEITRSFDNQAGQVELSNAFAELVYDYAVFLAARQEDDEAVRQFELAIDAGDASIAAQSLYQLAKIRVREQSSNEALVLIEQALGKNAPAGINKDIRILKAKIHFAEGDLVTAKTAVDLAIRDTRRGPLEYMNKQEADSLVEQLLLQSDIQQRLENSAESLDSLEYALAIHRVYHPRMLSLSAVKTRHQLQASLAKAQVAAGQIAASNHRQKKVLELARMIDCVPVVQRGITFPLGTALDDNLTCVALDDDENVYIAGNLSRGCDLQPGFGFQESESPSLLCKYDRLGALQWRCELAGLAVAMDIDENRNLFVKALVRRDEKTSIRVGDIDEKIPQGEDPICYVVKTDSNGRVLWIRWVPCGSYTKLYFEHSLALGQDGSVIVGGQFIENFKLRKQPPLVLRKRVDTKDNRQGYLAKFSSHGDVVWGRTIDAESSSVGGVDLDADGNIYFCGAAEAVRGAGLGTDVNGRPFALGPADREITRFSFLAKLNSEGETIWARYQVSDKSIAPQDVAVGSEGQVYYSKFVNANIDLDADNKFQDLRDQVDFWGKREWDSSLTSWTPDGKLLWNLPLGARWGHVSAYSLAARSREGVFMAGRAAGGNLVSRSEVLKRQPTGGRDGFIASVDKDGSIENTWYYTTGETPSRVVPWTITSNRRNQAAVVGRFIGTVRTPTGEILQQSRHSVWDGFVTILLQTRQSD